MRPRHTTPPPTPTANHTPVVRLADLGRWAAALAGWVLGWCWARWGLDAVVGFIAVALVPAAFAAGLADWWRHGRNLHEFDDIEARHQVDRALHREGGGR